ncbi:MAG: hypothetical protein JXR97_09350 [Planctomycetes bacterium]|nr:hypothetical protein [Planctomycetota bacterium]
MIVFVNSEGKPLPVDCVHLGEKMRCVRVTPGAYRIEASGDTFEITVTVTRDKVITVSRAISVSGGTKDKYTSGMATVTKDRHVTSNKVRSVTKWVGTVSRVSSHGVDKRTTKYVTIMKYV